MELLLLPPSQPGPRFPLLPHPCGQTSRRCGLASGPLCLALGPGEGRAQYPARGGTAAAVTRLSVPDSRESFSGEHAVFFCVCIRLDRTFLLWLVDMADSPARSESLSIRTHTGVRARLDASLQSFTCQFVSDNGFLHLFFPCLVPA